MSIVKWWRSRRELRSARHEYLAIGALYANGELAGWPLIRATGLGSGALYVALIRLERDGVVASRWLDGPQPRRRVYRLTERGAS
jgi:DNA-binding transcriptional regulator PaaX